MRTCRSPRLLAGFLLGFALPAGAAAIESPQLVSPGDGRREAQVGTACPTFSWTLVEGARSYTLMVYEVGDEGQKPVLSAELPARAASWTPSLETCLQHPGRYGWSVGARGEGTEPTWSQPGIFRFMAPKGEPPSTPQRPQGPTSLDGPHGRPVQSSSPSGERALSTTTRVPRSLTGEAFAPPACAGSVFSDVTVSHPYCAWIELLAADQIAGECAAGSYCPENPVTRGQLAMFMERAMRGTDEWRPELGDGSAPNLPPALPTRTQLLIGGGGGAEGFYSSITIGADGLGLISSYGLTFGDLLVSHCSNVNCTAATHAVWDGSVDDVGSYAAITIGKDGLGLISYYDATNGDLKVAHCANVNCTAADAITSLDTAADVGLHTSITIGADGFGLISYHDQSNFDLKVAHCANVTCSATTVPPISLDTAGLVGFFTSITIGADGFGLISYTDGTSNDLKVVHCGDADCTVGLATITALDFGPSPYETGLHTSVTIGADGLGLISYFESVVSPFDNNRNLRVAHCNDVNCTDATKTTLDNAGDTGLFTSVTIGADGLGLISYYDESSKDLKVAHCSNVDCTAATVTPVDTAGFVGQFSSITIGADGLGLISYYDQSNGDLKAAHCSNVLCAPFFRRR